MEGADGAHAVWSNASVKFLWCGTRRRSEGAWKVEVGKGPPWGLQYCAASAEQNKIKREQSDGVESKQCNEDPRRSSFSLCFCLIKEKAKATYHIPPDAKAIPFPAALNIKVGAAETEISVRAVAKVKGLEQAPDEVVFVAAGDHGHVATKVLVRLRQGVAF